MKLIAALVAGGLALTWSLGAATAEDPKKQKTKTDTAQARVQQKKAASRSSPGHCGLRNHGKRLSQLDLNNPCDQEEFWTRMQERGGDQDD